MMVLLPVRNGGGFRCYSSAANRKRAITMLEKHGYDYFTTYQASRVSGVDNKHGFGLSFGRRKDGSSV